VHETYHYTTDADENTVQREVDIPLGVAFYDAKARRLQCVSCAEQSPSWRVYNVLELFACQCGIKVR
jgi:hypothetical protein